MEDLSVLALSSIFVLAAIAVCIAGVFLTQATDVIDELFELGQAFGGLVLLAVVTNLPEIAITISAASSGRVDVAVGNLLGGVAIQTLLLAFFDISTRSSQPLSTSVASPVTIVASLLVILVLAIVLIGHQLPPQMIFAGFTPDGLFILVTWLGGLFLIKRLSTRRQQSSSESSTNPVSRSKTLRAIALFLLMAIVTLIGGVMLEVTGDMLAKHWHMEGALFGATILAAATALPELATGLPAARNHKPMLAVSDILGGNALLPVLLLLATIVSGYAAMPAADTQTIYMTYLGILMTFVFLGGVLLRPPRKILGMGPDSWLLVLVYIIGVTGLLYL